MWQHFEKICAATRDVETALSQTREIEITLVKFMDEIGIPFEDMRRAQVFQALFANEYHVVQEIRLREAILKNEGDDLWRAQVEATFEMNMDAICDYCTTQIALALMS
jgi:hypothetical protein